jgi:thioesterase domain-containing protein
MEDAEFSDEFCRFLQEAIPAVDAAELLLLAADRPDAWASAAELVERLRPKAQMTEEEARRYLDVFVARGLLEAGADGRVRYRAASEALAKDMRTLAQAYEERPVTLVRVIYALKDAKIRTFAEAFRLRKK